MLLLTYGSETMWKQFEKYQGLGNDFMLVAFDPGADHMPWERDDWSDSVVARACDRHTGVGADGVIFCGVLGDARVRMVIFNQDGSRPEMCGNGVRCVAAWALRRGLASSEGELCVVSDAGERACVLSTSSSPLQVSVGMGQARLEERAEEVILDGTPLSIWRVDMGNPHAVMFLPRGAAMPSLEEIDRLGRAANESPELFAHGVNLEIVREVEAGACGEPCFEVIVYERGVGRTQACGTGACAVAVAAWRAEHADKKQEVAVRLPGGILKISEDERGEIWMKGPAEHVFDATMSDAAYLAGRSS